MKSKLQDLDLNLLKLLKTVVETRNTHTAAEKLGISQTSVSRGLSKLKEVFGEQLFIRKAHGIEPSELAERLADTNDKILNSLIQVVESYHQFDPIKFDGEIRIAMSIFFLDIHGDAIFEALHGAFPNASFKLLYWQEQSLLQLLNGDLDYMIHFEGYPLPQEVFCHKLEEIKLCIVARKNHPNLTNSSDWDSIKELPIARVIADGVNSKLHPEEIIYPSKGYKPNISLVTHSIRVLLSTLCNSDTIMFGSHHISSMDSRLSSYPLPELPADMRNMAVWGGYLRSKRDYPLNQHIHKVIQSYFKEVSADH